MVKGHLTGRSLHVYCFVSFQAIWLLAFKTYTFVPVQIYIRKRGEILREIDDDNGDDGRGGNGPTS